MMRNRSERGATMVEGALVIPLVLLLIFAIIWGALLYRTVLTANHAAASGARASSVAANSVDADFQILDALKPSLNAVNKSAIKRIVVYPATTFSDTPSAACLASGTGCNIYSAADLNKPDPTSASQWPGDAGFPATGRSVSGADTSLVGVYVELKPGTDGLFIPSPSLIKAHKVTRIEPHTF
jgi:hypothetical protein